MSDATDDTAPPTPLQQIGVFLIGRLPNDCARGVLRIQSTRSTSQSVYNAYRADGSVEHLKINLEASGYLYALRASMYKPGVGTWFSAEFTVTREGSVDVSFDYDSEPEWHQSINPRIYIDDLSEFARDDDHMPDWLARDVAFARAGGTVVHGHPHRNSSGSRGIVE